ncbi:Hypp1455 [Branchiostoma lanceolatum]|uniref:Hypp1455 protein n=1 Tax=Branchiostoma lanceolatum TaxID=7740 RepID=A0A8J9ZI28_BRALA|nr:Hypp1455 [Branchiostoma lanceolatum]
MAFTSKDRFFQALSQGYLDRIKTLLDKRMDVDAVLEIKQMYTDEHGEEQLLTLMEYYRKMINGSALYHNLGVSTS